MPLSEPGVLKQAVAWVMARQCEQLLIQLPLGITRLVWEPELHGEQQITTCSFRASPCRVNAAIARR